ncbi:MAG: hypothetical protein RLP12_16365 [Ekhidna sp.]
MKRAGQALASTKKRVVILLLLGVSAIRCATSPGNNLILYRVDDPRGQPEVVRGVINGVYKYDPEQTREQLEEWDSHLSSSDIEAFSERYIVRVGIDRQSTMSAISGFITGVIWGISFADYVLLPPGWIYSYSEIVNFPNFVNVGDVVDIEIQTGRSFDHFVALVRKCNEQPEPDENPD